MIRKLIIALVLIIVLLCGNNGTNWKRHIHQAKSPGVFLATQ